MKIIFGIIFVIISDTMRVSAQFNLPPQEALINTTVMLKLYKPANSPTGTASDSVSGTGFLFNFRIGNKEVPVLVTNKHVVKGAVGGSMYFHELTDVTKYSYSENKMISFQAFKDRWIFHPDSNVDLAILPIQEILEYFRKLSVHLYPVYFDESTVPDKATVESMNPIEDILMIGYPSGLWDSHHNVPIVRKGITATPPFLDLEGAKEFLCDIPVFPGSSGSPIIIYQTAPFIDRNGLAHAGNRIQLLGINYAAEQHPYIGTLRRKVKGAKGKDSISVREKVTYTLPYNLAYAIKSERILDFKKVLEEKISKDINSLGWPRPAHKEKLDSTDMYEKWERATIALEAQKNDYEMSPEISRLNNVYEKKLMENGVEDTALAWKILSAEINTRISSSAVFLHYNNNYYLIGSWSGLKNDSRPEPTFFHSIFLVDNDDSLYLKRDVVILDDGVFGLGRKQVEKDVAVGQKKGTYIRNAVFNNTDDYTWLHCLQEKVYSYSLKHDIVVVNLSYNLNPFVKTLLNRGYRPIEISDIDSNFQNSNIEKVYTFGYPAQSIVKIIKKRYEAARDESLYVKVPRIGQATLTMPIKPGERFEVRSEFYYGDKGAPIVYNNKLIGIVASEREVVEQIGNKSVCITYATITPARDILPLIKDVEHRIVSPDYSGTSMYQEMKSEIDKKMQ